MSVKISQDFREEAIEDWILIARLYVLRYEALEVSKKFAYIELCVYFKH